MNNKYLLPCRCGEKLSIELRQAGEEVVCRCGARMQVPTMLEIRALEPAAAADETSARGAASWGWRQQLRLLGVFLMLSGIFAGGWLFLTRPIAIADVMPPEVLQHSAKKLTPAQTWTEWQRAKLGLDRRQDTRYIAARTRYHIWISVSGVLALGGVALIVVGATRPQANPSA
ncbi:MAG: hypothetical protein GX594_00660 [Pirellulaceae bacterium]|nr:hypothetical protein [Pirellulaceae bacterium]